MSSFTPTKVPKMHKCRKGWTHWKGRKGKQRTHTTKYPRSFHEYTPKFRKYHDCTLQVSHVHRCQVFARPNLHPEVSQCAKIQGFGQPKTTLQVSRCLPKPPNWHFAVPKPSKSPFKVSKSNKTTPRVPLYSWGSGVSDYPTTPMHPTKHPHPPRSLSGYLIASKIRTFQGKILHLGVSTSHRPRHR